jgi:Tol biopolymer transport system component
VTESKGQSFWASLPGVVTAIAGMVTAIVILVTTLASLPAFQGQPSGSAAPSSPISPSSGASEESASVEPSTAPTASTDASTTPVPSSTTDDRARILFYSVRTDPDSGADNADLYAVDPATGVERRLTTDPRPDSYPAGLPGGDRIAFDSRRGGNRDIWLLEADGSYRQLTNDARDDAYPTWSPDGTQIAWAAGPGREREIWVMNADGSGARRLTTGADDLLPSWSSTGLIAFERHVGAMTEIWVVDPAGGGASARITSDDGGGGDPTWSPDGRRLAFSRQVDGIHRIFVVDANGQSGLHSVTPSADCDCEEPAWSPDGTEIAYVGPGSGGVVRPIVVVPVDGGEPRRITTNGLAPWWAG